MAKVKDETLFRLIHSFLTIYLPTHRNVSANTIKTYRTAILQFLNFVSRQKGIRIVQVTASMFNRKMVEAFLEDITQEKNCSTSTRNNRLAAIRSFMSYASSCRPEYIDLLSELSAIKIQKQDVYSNLKYMTEEAVAAMFAEPDVTTELGLRDQVLMILLYDTGARIQELLGIRLCDIKLGHEPKVTLFGKGRKVRVVPLMENTLKHLKNYLTVFHHNTPVTSETWLFYTHRKNKRTPLGDDAVRKLLKKYAEKARMRCPDVPENMHPHLWRHTRAMHLYQHGMDLTMVSQWLGHTTIQTTLVYAYADTEAKRDAINAAMSNGSPDIPDEKPFSITDEETLL